MNKKEERKMMVKAALNCLENEFGAFDISNDDGARFDFVIESESGFTFNGQIDRRDLTDVMFMESISLSGNGWTEEDFRKQEEAVSLENTINARLEEVISGVIESIS